MSPSLHSLGPAPPHIVSSRFQASAHTHSSLLISFQTLSAALTTQTIIISTLLNSLISNSTRRIECVYSLERLRIERDQVLTLQSVVVTRERELLAQVERELDMFERERDRERNAAVDAAIAGARSADSECEIAGSSSRRRRSFGSQGHNSSAGSISEVNVDDDVLVGVARQEVDLVRPRRLSMSDTRPISDNASLSSPSSSRLSSLLTSIATSRSNSTTYTRSELNRVNTLTSSTSRILTQLSLERNILSNSLLAAETRRSRDEIKMMDSVLELVLSWDLGRKEAKYRKEEEEREMEELERMMEETVWEDEKRFGRATLVTV